MLFSSFWRLGMSVLLTALWSLFWEVIAQRDQMVEKVLLVRESVIRP